MTVLHGFSDVRQIIRVGERKYFQRIFLFVIFNPIEPYVVRIDTKRKTGRLSDQNAVLNGILVVGQTVQIPAEK